MKVVLDELVFYRITTCALKRDTAGDHHRVIDPAEAEGSENNRAHERSHRKVRTRAMVGESSSKRPFHNKNVYQGDPEEKSSHMNVPPCWAVLDCGAAKSLAGAELAAMLAKMIARSRLWKRDTMFVESETR